jgi:hypothetical protein
MAKRGKVLRDPHFGPGLLIVEGKQYPFLMEGIWRSDVPAKPGLVVNVDFDQEGNLNGITAVPQAQLSQEQAELARAGYGARSAIFESWAIEPGTLMRLAVVGLLALSWFFLTAVSIQLPVFGKLDVTFWQLLGFLNSGNSQQISDTSSADPGIFGLLAMLALAGPFLHCFWKDPRALFGGLLPLSFMVVVACRISSTHGAMTAQVTGPYEHLPANLHYGIFSVLTVGFGTYLSASLATYLAVLSARQFLGSSRLQPMECSQKMAA